MTALAATNLHLVEAPHRSTSSTIIHSDREESEILGADARAGDLLVASTRRRLDRLDTECGAPTSTCRTGRPHPAHPQRPPPHEQNESSSRETSTAFFFCCIVHGKLSLASGLTPPGSSDMRRHVCRLGKDSDSLVIPGDGESLKGVHDHEHPS